MISTNNPPSQTQALHNKEQGADAYSFAAEPRAVQQRKKYRDPNEAEPEG